jgi:hypothetical protein
MVFPFDGFKLGVCPKGDIWESFPNINDLGELSGRLNDIFNTIYNEVPNNYKEFVEICKKIDDGEMEEYGVYIDLDGYDNIYDMLSNNLTPKPGFKVLTNKKYSINEKKSIK